MKTNTIILLKGNRMISREYYKKFNKGDTIWGEDVDPIELKRWSINQKEEAEAELVKHKCEYSWGQELFYATVYALEYCECDEDGEFVVGSDYELAEEKKED